MKAAILAGGYGTRLKPFTRAINKHLIPIYDKPMLLYPLSNLVLMGFKEILIVCLNKKSVVTFKKILKDVVPKSVKIKYAIQANADGIPGGMSLCKNFFKGQKNKVFILGDNFFYGNSFISDCIKQIKKNLNTIFLQKVNDPSEYGVVQKKKTKLYFFEKPKKFKSNLAITGLYIFDEDLFCFINNIKKSKRGEYEIIDIIKQYYEKKKLNLKIFSQGICWYDLGNYENILSCSNFIKIFKDRQNIDIGNFINK